MEKNGEKLRVIFNSIILGFSILAILFITIVWKIHDFSVVMSYILSTLVSLLAFHQLKVRLPEVHSSYIEESVEMRFPLNVRERQTLFLFIVIALILATPLIILFFIPRLWLVVLNGMVSGATLSELIIYFRRDATAGMG